MHPQTNLTNHFLIAMPNLADPNFFHTVTYICEHTDQGAMGIVINRPTELSVSELFEHMKITADASQPAEKTIYNGGPVEAERGFVLHRYDRDWDSTMRISEQVAITTTRDIIEAIAHNQAPEQNLIALGYAGWGEGQLEQELADNAWLYSPASLDILFDLPTQDRWKAAAEKIGVDLNLLSTSSGHA